MEIITGGVTAPKGFRASGIHCGIRKNHDKKDLAMIVSNVTATAAAVYTTNLVKGAPITVTKNHLEDGLAKAVIVNSGNANTCNSDGIEVAEKMCGFVEEYVGVRSDDVIIASTGVIGQKLDTLPIEKGMRQLTDNLSYEGSDDAAAAIMTTDTVPKSIAVSFMIGDTQVKLGGIAKGSGMIHPNLATMLVFLTTDCAISSRMLRKALSTDIASTFNMVSVDGDTSTNDMVSIMANGLAGNELINEDGEAFQAFMKALNTVNMFLCRAIAGDGEGATKLVECTVTGAASLDIARGAAKSVITSSLVKAAMFGADANWGRVLCALGYSGLPIDPDDIDVSFVSAKGEVVVCTGGRGVNFSEEKAKEILLEDEITIRVGLNSGEFTATAWGCDLTYDYVKINGDYRT